MIAQLEYRGKDELSNVERPSKGPRAPRGIRKHDSQPLDLVRLVPEPTGEMEAPRTFWAPSAPPACQFPHPGCKACNAGSLSDPGRAPGPCSPSRPPSQPHSVLTELSSKLIQFSPTVFFPPKRNPSVTHANNTLCSHYAGTCPSTSPESPRVKQRAQGHPSSSGGNDSPALPRALTPGCSRRRRAGLRASCWSHGTWGANRANFCEITLVLRQDWDPIYSKSPSDWSSQEERIILNPVPLLRWAPPAPLGKKQAGRVLISFSVESTTWGDSGCGRSDSEVFSWSANGRFHSLWLPEEVARGSISLSTPQKHTSRPACQAELQVAGARVGLTSQMEPLRTRGGKEGPRGLCCPRRSPWGRSPICSLPGYRQSSVQWLCTSLRWQLKGGQAIWVILQPHLPEDHSHLMSR